MSCNVFSSGFMVPIKDPMSREKREEIAEKLEKSDLSISYDGSILYSDITHDHDGGYGIMFDQRRDDSAFVRSYIEADIEVAIDYQYIKWYTCLWYNGGDSDMGMMTRDKFMEINW